VRPVAIVDSVIAANTWILISTQIIKNLHERVPWDFIQPDISAGI